MLINVIAKIRVPNSISNSVDIEEFANGIKKELPVISIHYGHCCVAHCPVEKITLEPMEEPEDVSIK